MALNDFLRWIPTTLERRWATTTPNGNVIGCLQKKVRDNLPYLLYVNGVLTSKASYEGDAYREYNKLCANN